MPKIVFYVSDYGYGHASRMIALIREIQKQSTDIDIIVRTKFASEFIKRSCPSIRVFSTPNDFGLIHKGNQLTINIEATLRQAYREFFYARERYVERETRFLRDHANLAVVDVPPLSCLAARTAGIPSIIVSNFNWFHIYRKLYQHVSRTSLSRRASTRKTQLLKSIRESYDCCDLCLTLPFDVRMELFKKRKSTALIARIPFRSRSLARKMLGVPEQAILIFVSLGQSRPLSRKVMTNISRSRTGDKVFLFSYASQAMPANAICLPKNDTESQDYVAASDIAVSKPGYSTVAECVANHVPLILTNRPFYPEDLKISKDLERHGVAIRIGNREFENAAWTERIDEVLELKENFDRVPSRWKNIGAAEAAKEILAFV